MLRDSNDSGNDGGLVNGYTMEDVDEDTLNAYRIDYDTLSAPEQVVLATAYLEKEVNNNRLQSLLSLNPIEVGKILAQLTQNNFII